MRLLNFDHLNPQTWREWAVAVFLYWPIAPIYLIFRGIAESRREGAEQ